MKYLMTRLFFSAASMLLSSTAGTIESGISGAMQNVWNVITGIVGPIAAVVLAVCAIKMIVGSRNAAEEAKSTAIKIIIGVCLVLIAPSIIQAIIGWFNVSSWSF